MSTLDTRTSQSIAAYDQHARAYQESLRLKRPTADVRRFAAFAERGDLVLDVGCGPANDLRLLRDAGVHPVGVDLSMGSLTEARMLLPRHPLIRTPIDDLPFRERSFGGIWMSSAFTHLPRETWRDTFTYLLRFLDEGPVYFSCYRGNADMREVEDEVLGTIFISAALEDEIEKLFAEARLEDVRVEVRPDPVHDRRRPWVVALGTRR